MGQRTKWQCLNSRASGFRIALDMLRKEVRVLETLRIRDTRSNMRAKDRRIAFGSKRRGAEKVVNSRRDIEHVG